MLQKVLKFPFYIYILPIFSVLTLYSQNAKIVSVNSFLVTQVIALGIFQIIYLIFSLILKDKKKAGMITLFLGISFFSYGHLHQFIIDTFITPLQAKADFRNLSIVSKYNLRLHAPLIIVFTLVFYFVYKFLKKNEKRIENFHLIANKTSLILLFVSIMNALIVTFQSNLTADSNKEVAVQPLSNKEDYRDIYYIVLDGYGREDTLKNHYGFDNSPFVEGLRSRGFHVSDNSHSNYFWTFLSLSSSLNFEYHQENLKNIDKDSQDLSYLYRIIRDNKLNKFLQTKGYQTIHFNSTWGATMNNPLANKQIGLSFSLFNDDFFQSWSKTTFLKIFNSIFNEKLSEFYKFTFQELKNIPLEKSPKFVFSHLIIPHYPYVFNSDGSVHSDKTLTNQFKQSQWDQKDKYINQMIYLNKVVLEIIDEILSKSSIKPVILIQSDHGPSLSELGEIGKARERFKNFNAILIPDYPRISDFENITPVNNFRYILNHLFNSGLSILPNQSFWSEFSAPYLFKQFNHETANFIK